MQVLAADQRRRAAEALHPAAEDQLQALKITDEDWRNRKKWNEYEQAVCDMVDRTSTEIAPWTLVAAEDKYLARIQVLKTIAERMEAAL